jgi:hypothetical protein
VIPDVAKKPIDEQARLRARRWPKADRVPAPSSLAQQEQPDGGERRVKEGQAQRRDDAPRPMSEMSSITPRPLRTPPLAYMSSVMTTMSRQACSESCRLNLLADAQHELQHDREEQVTAGDVAEQSHAVRAELQFVVVETVSAEEEHRDRDAVQVEVAAARSRTTPPRRARAAREQFGSSACVAIQRRRGPSRACSSLQ